MVLGFQPVDDDLQVQLAHARDHGLLGLVVEMDLEGRVFQRQLVQRRRQLVALLGRRRLDLQVDDGFRVMDVFQQHRFLFAAQGVAGGGELGADQGGDVAGADGVDLLAAVGVDAQDAADPFALVLDRVVNVAAGGQFARIDADECLLADVGVVDDLEGQGGERLLGRGLARDRFFRIVEVAADDDAAVDGRGQVIDHGVEQQADALVLEGGAAEYRGDAQGQDGVAGGALDVLLADLPVVQEFFHQFQVEIGQPFDHFGAKFLGLGQHVFRDGADLHLHFLVGDGLHFHQVDHAAEIFLAADGQLIDQGVGAQHVVHHGDGLEQVAALAVHLVDEGDARHLVAVGLVPDGLALRLDAAHGAEDHDDAVQHAQRALHLHGEIDVARECR